MENYQDEWYSSNSNYGAAAGQMGGSIGGNPQFSRSFNPNITSTGFDNPRSDDKRTDYDFEDEPPLLEELGINFEHIYGKTLSVFNPMRTLNEDMLTDSDLAGPFFFSWLQGVCLLLSGKLQFGYLFGFGLVGCLLLHTLFNLMQQQLQFSIDGYRVVSILGYSLLPMVLLSGISIAFNLSSGSLGMMLTFLSTIWSTITATRFFEATLRMPSQRYLIAYPVFMFYASYALITVF